MKILPNIKFAVTFKLNEDTLPERSFVGKNLTYSDAIKCREERAKKKERSVDDYKIEPMSSKIDKLNYIGD